MRDCLSYSKFIKLAEEETPKPDSAAKDTTKAQEKPDRTDALIAGGASMVGGAALGYILERLLHQGKKRSLLRTLLYSGLGGLTAGAGGYYLASKEEPTGEGPGLVGKAWNSIFRKNRLAAQGTGAAAGAVAGYAAEKGVSSGYAALKDAKRSADAYKAIGAQMGVDPKGLTRVVLRSAKDPSKTYVAVVPQKDITKGGKIKKNKSIPGLPSDDYIVLKQGNNSGILRRTAKNILSQDTDFTTYALATGADMSANKANKGLTQALAFNPAPKGGVFLKNLKHGILGAILPITGAYFGNKAGGHIYDVRQENETLSN